MKVSMACILVILTSLSQRFLSENTVLTCALGFDVLWLACVCSFSTVRSPNWSSFSVLAWFRCSVFWFPSLLLLRLCTGICFWAVHIGLLLVDPPLRVLGAFCCSIFVCSIDLVVIGGHCWTAASCFRLWSALCCAISWSVIFLFAFDLVVDPFSNPHFGVMYGHVHDCLTEQFIFSLNGAVVKQCTVLRVCGGRSSVSSVAWTPVWFQWVCGPGCYGPGDVSLAIFVFCTFILDLSWCFVKSTKESCCFVLRL